MTGTRDQLLAEAMLMNDAPVLRDEDWWRGAIFYQVYLRSFQDSDGDGIGDLPGVTRRLDYLADLGIDGIWLAPFYLSPQKDFGYDVSALRAVDPAFGTLTDLLDLLDGAHKRGLKVLADFIPCHTSDQHKWFGESRRSRDNDKADWYVWADASPDGTPPNNWLSSFGGPAWTWEPRRSQYYYHPFLTCQPALNLRNPDALGAVIDAMAYWRDLGIDGFRLDAIQCLCWDTELRSNPARITTDDDIALGGGPNNPFARQDHLFDRDVPHGLEIIERIRADLTRDHVEFALIGELADIDTSRMAVKYTAGEERLHAVYDFDLVHKGGSIRQVIETLRTRSTHIGAGWLMNVMTNHDSTRAVSNLTGFAVDAGKRAEAAKALLFLQATLKGGAIVFQGEELGLTQPEIAFEDLQDPWAINLYPDFEGRDGVRTPFPWRGDQEHGGFTNSSDPWLPIPEEHLPLAVDRQTDDDASVLSFFRALLAWRQKHPFIKTGEEDVCSEDNAPVIAFDRWDKDKRWTFMVNFGLVDRFYPTEMTLVDFPHSTAQKDSRGVHLPAFGFAVLNETKPSD